MIKIRVTFTDNKKGKKELEELIKSIDSSNLQLVSKSGVYASRNKDSKYSRIYLDVELEE